MFLVSLFFAVFIGVICRYLLLERVASLSVMRDSFQGKVGGVLGYFLLVILPAFTVFFFTWGIGIKLLAAIQRRGASFGEHKPGEFENAEEAHNR